MKNVYRKRFAKFESKKRAKLGDRVFLEKYITAFTKSNKILKVIFPVMAFVFPLNVVLQALFFAKDMEDIFRLAMLILWIFITLIWAFVAYVYYTHHFKFHEEKINEWTAELKGQDLNTAKETEKANCKAQE